MYRNKTRIYRFKALSKYLRACNGIHVKRYRSQYEKEMFNLLQQCGKVELGTGTCYT